MCQKATLLESPAVTLSGVDARESRDTAIQERVDTPPIREASARAARAKVMEERRRELEQSISQAKTKSKPKAQNKSNKRSGEDKADEKQKKKATSQDAANKNG